MNKTIKHVVAGLVFYQSKLFAAQRSEKDDRYLKYEFPGGKLEIGETSEQALIRELSEELEMKIRVSHLFMHVSHEYPSFQLEMDVLVAFVDEDKFSLLVHAGGGFFTKEQLAKLSFLGADQKIVEEIIKQDLFANIS